MKRIPLTQGQFAIVDDEDFDWLMQWKWHALWGNCTQQFMAARSYWIEDKSYKSLMHREILGAAKGQCVDHWNRNELDNRRRNLRICSHSQNCCNIKQRSDNTSGFRGVHWYRNRSLWCAIINVNRKGHCLGYFSSKLDAAIAYDRAALKLHGEFARTNFSRSVK